jgi:hypothetical protein
LTKGKNIDCFGIHHRSKPLQQEGAPQKHGADQYQHSDSSFPEHQEDAADQSPFHFAPYHLI